MRRTLRGFTLVEILVVVAVLAILTVICFGVFSRVREKGRSATCQNNLKQIALAVQQYVQDNDGSYPLYSDSPPSADNVKWDDRILPYLKDARLYDCPTWIPPDFMPTQLSGRPDYDLNVNIVNTWLRGKHEVALLYASTTWLNKDSVIANSTPPDPPAVHVGRVLPSPCGGRNVFAPTVHLGGGNVSFLDGHVKWLAPEGLAKSECANGPTSGSFEEVPTVAK